MSRTPTPDGLGTVSAAKAGRIYDRAFSHEEAQALHEAGWSYNALAERYGVSPAGVRRVCDPAVRAKMDEDTQRWCRENRMADCLGGCGRRVWLMNKERSGYCARCVGAIRTADSVRENELRCSKCGEWKPDDDFLCTPNKHHSRREHKSTCRACENAARRDYRKRHVDHERAQSRNYKREKKRNTPMGNYVVLRKTDEGTWRELERVNAASRLHAIERIADSEGVYAAVNEGQLNELTVQQTLAFKVSRNGSDAA